MRLLDGTALRGMMAAVVVAGLSAATPAPAGEAVAVAGDLIFADRGPWDLGAGELVWTLTHQGPALPGFLQISEGRVALSQAVAPPGGVPVLELERRADRTQSLRMGPFPVSGGDPVVVYFLETTVRDMASLTGGSPFYIRNRIREALSTGGKVVETDGVTTVEVRPFEDDANRSRMGGFDTLALRFVIDADAGAPIREMVATTETPVAVKLPPGMMGQQIAPAAYRHALVLQ